MFLQLSENPELLELQAVKFYFKKETAKELLQDPKFREKLLSLLEVNFFLQDAPEHYFDDLQFEMDRPLYSKDSLFISKLVDWFLIGGPWLPRTMPREKIMPNFIQKKHDSISEDAMNWLKKDIAEFPVSMRASMNIKALESFFDNKIHILALRNFKNLKKAVERLAKKEKSLELGKMIKLGYTAEVTHTLASFESWLSQMVYGFRTYHLGVFWGYKLKDKEKLNQMLQDYLDNTIKITDPKIREFLEKAIPECYIEAIEILNKKTDIESLREHLIRKNIARATDLEQEFQKQKRDKMLQSVEPIKYDSGAPKNKPIPYIRRSKEKLEDMPEEKVDSKQPTFELTLSSAAQNKLDTIYNLEDTQQQKGLKKQLEKTLELLKVNQKHPGLNSHVFTENGEKVWVSYVQNNTPRAYRVFWRHGSNQTIEIIDIVPHY